MQPLGAGSQVDPKNEDKAEHRQQAADNIGLENVYDGLHHDIDNYRDKNSQPPLGSISSPIEAEKQMTQIDI
jgi:hypothetical protein